MPEIKIFIPPEFSVEQRLQHILANIPEEAVKITTMTLHKQDYDDIEYLGEEDNLAIADSITVEYLIKSE